MFLINLTYKTELNKIDQFLNEHIQFLNEQYKLGNFLLSGGKNPRTGGIILCQITNKSVLQEIIEKDPFKIHDLANYELTVFTPTKTCNELKFLLK
ncbi:YciI family protein [Tenacibaculum pacificus]|uniref:YciI family protein n=1 Tax=Tenacibaculum pacificus TaxID=3018314 RepID=UPI0022F3ED5E|nr:YciI family protein [Tenacibaculum pacificus]WBX74193.1 YciI family protein [Tenacibaculum pacificus]